MNEQKLKNLIELVTFDQTLNALEHRITLSDSTMKELQHQLQLLEQQLQQHGTKQAEAQKQLADQELKVKELQDQESHQSQLSNAVASTKEYEAANKETERIKFDRNLQEQRMMNMINKMTAINKDYETFQAHCAAEKTKVLELIAQEEAAVKEVAVQLANLQKDRQTKISDIPAEWLNTYETMRGRVANPVVPVVQDSCSACFYFMSARDSQALRQQGLLQCKDCFRFLYHEPVA